MVRYVGYSAFWLTALQNAAKRRAALAVYIQPPPVQTLVLGLPVTVGHAGVCLWWTRTDSSVKMTNSLFSWRLHPFRYSCSFSQLNTLRVTQYVLAQRRSIQQKKDCKRIVPAQFSSRWYLCAREVPYALHRLPCLSLPLKQFQCWSD